MTNAENPPPIETRIGRWEWDIATNAVHWDESMSALLGLPIEPFSGRYGDLIARVLDDDRPQVIRAFAATLENRANHEGELRVVWPDGSLHRVRIHALAHFDESGKARTVSGSCWDAGLASQGSGSIRPPELGNSNAIKRTLLAALMDHLPDNIYFKDRESRFIAVNRAMAEWFGARDPRSMIGKSDFDLFTWEHAQAAVEAEREILRTGKPVVNSEERETWPDGHETWVSTTKMPLRDSDGNIIGTFGLSRDLTERKTAEKQLAQFAAELRAKNEALEEELQMARELQYTMLPQTFPRFGVNGSGGEGAARFHHFYQPSTAVSGDFFDVFKIAEHVAGLFICDVMGHGVRAALVAATIRALAGGLRSRWADPGAFLVELNRLLRHTLRNNRTPLFVSAFYFTIDFSTGESRCANAGHPRPFLVHPDGSGPAACPMACKNGPALGLFDDPAYPVWTRPLVPNDTVLLFTDGLFEVEGPDGDVYDYERLLCAVEKHSHRPIQELCSDVVEEVQQFSASREFSDDVCLLAMQIDRLISLNAHGQP